MILHNRKSIRLKGYDYSKEGYYFVTICVNNREKIFGEIINGNMILNQYGKIIKNEWERTELLRPNIKIDEYIIMPDHFHGIIKILNSNNKRSTGVLQYAPTKSELQYDPTKARQKKMDYIHLFLLLNYR